MYRLKSYLDLLQLRGSYHSYNWYVIKRIRMDVFEAHYSAFERIHNHIILLAPFRNLVYSKMRLLSTENFF